MRVEARGVTKRFGPVVAVRDLHFAIPPGRRVALVGPNGSGKSTVNRILMGLLRFEGDVRLDGRSPREERAEIAARLAYVPQAAPAVAAPVGELVGALARLRGVEPAQVEKLAARLDLDVAAVARRPFRHLSGGMKQKLLIALALAADASLWILDEPTGSLDPRSRERFFALFAERVREGTVLLCSHRLEEIRQLVDHVMLLEEGRLAYEGPASAFLDASSLCVLEVRVEGEAAAAWLRERGFRPGAAGWWLRTLPRGDKVPLLAELTGRLGAALRDVGVRDLERLELDECDGRAAHGPS